MKNIVSRKKLREFWERHPDTEETLKTWYKVVMKANWKSSNEVKNQYGNASIIKDNRIIFNICGNKYRLVAKFNYEMQWVWIRFLGTHAEPARPAGGYDKIDALTI